MDTTQRRTVEVLGLHFTFPTVDLAAEATAMVAVAYEACRVARNEADDAAARQLMVAASRFAAEHGEETSPNYDLAEERWAERRAFRAGH